MKRKQDLMTLLLAWAEKLGEVQLRLATTPMMVHQKRFMIKQCYMTIGSLLVRGIQRGVILENL